MSSPTLNIALALKFCQTPLFGTISEVLPQNWNLQEQGIHHLFVVICLKTETQLRDKNVMCLPEDRYYALILACGKVSEAKCNLS